MPWFASGYPRGGSIPSGSVWFEYRGLSHASNLHDRLHGTNYSAADTCLHPLRFGAGWMKPQGAIDMSLYRPWALGRVLVESAGRYHAYENSQPSLRPLKVICPKLS